MKDIFRTWFRKNKTRIERRLDKSKGQVSPGRVLSARNIHYEVSNKTNAIVHGGIGLVHAMVNHIKLAETIDEHLHLLKVHLPYRESDHVLNFAYNAFCDGTCLEDIELRRNNATHLDALGARRIPDPTTAGDFCRRFDGDAHDALTDALNETRLRVWAKQPDAFFDCATVDITR